MPVPHRSDPADVPVGTIAADGHAPVPLVNIANVLTVLRIVLVPVFLVALFVDSGHDTTWRIVAAAVFAVAAVTDRFDGQLARKHGLVTDFGKLADPIADKALIGAALVGLSVLGDLTWWVTGLIAARELGITALRFFVLRHGVIPASRGGKLKTLVQSAAIFLYLLPLPASWEPYLLALIWVAVALTLITGADYVVQAVRLRRHPRRGDTHVAAGAGPGAATANLHDPAVAGSVAARDAARDDDADQR